jgi:plasmid replication initiation protein
MQKEEDKLISRSYDLILKHGLTIHEMRIMLRLIEALQTFTKDYSLAQKTTLEDIVLYLPVNSLVPVVDTDYSYDLMRSSFKSLEQKKVAVYGMDSEGEYVTHAGLIMQSSFYFHNRVVKVQLSRDLLPDLLALSRDCAKYLDLKVAFNSSSLYVMKLYLLVSHLRSKTNETVSLDVLRDWLDLEAKYEHPSDIKRWVLEPVSKELQELADVWFEVDSTVKSGKLVTGYVFKICERGATVKNG